MDNNTMSHFNTTTTTNINNKSPSTTEGILIHPLLSPSIVRHLLQLPTTNNNLNLILGKETHLTLLTLPTTINHPSATNTDDSLLLNVTTRFNIPIFGTIKDLKLFRLNDGEVVILGVSDSGLLSILRVETTGEEEEKKMDSQVSILREILLDLPGHHYQYLGRSIAVDNQTGSFTVAAWLNQFRIFFLPPNLTTHNLPDAVLEDWTFSLPGIIWNLTYLYPTTSTEPRRPTLVLIVFDDIDKSANLVMYEFFNTTTSTPTIAHQISRLPLVTVAGDGLPLHLIPLPQIPEALLVITETQILFITSDFITSGVMLFPRFDLPNSPDCLEAPLITCWADPNSHHPDRSLNYFYLGCDKGNLYRLDLIQERTDSSLRLTLLGQLGHGSLGRNLLVLDHQQGRDLLGYSGDFSDGGIMWVDPFTPEGRELVMKKPKHKLSRRSPPKDPNKLYPAIKLTSWAPVIDFEIISPPTVSIHYKHSVYLKSLSNHELDNKDQFIPKSPPIIYTCAGVHPHGAIHKVQYGHLSESYNLTPGGLINGNCLQNLFRIDLNHQALFGLSFPHLTKIIDGSNLEECTGLGIQSHLQSMFMGRILGSNCTFILIQVTRHSIILSDPAEPIVINLDDSIILADVTRDYLVIITNQLDLMVFKLNHSLDKLTTVTLTHQPTCLSLVINNHNALMILVGTYQPTIVTYELTTNQLINSVGEFHLGSFNAIELGTPHTILVKSDYFLVGLRDGFLLRFQWDSDSFQPSLTHITRAGTLPVNLVAVDPYIITVSDKIKLYHPTDAIQTLVLNDIVGDIGNPLHVIPFRSSNHKNTIELLYGDIISSNLHLKVLEIMKYPGHHPHKLPIRGTPKRLLYHSPSSNLIVLTYIPSSDSTAFSCFLSVIDSVNGTVLTEQKAPDCEQGYALLEWDGELARTHIPGRSLYLLATGPIGNDKRISPLNDFGYIYSFNLEWSESHTRLSSLTRLLNLETMVTSIEQYQNYLLVGVGESLHLYQLSYDNGSVALALASSRGLGSQIHGISTHDPTIAVATQPTSVFFFTVDDHRQLKLATSSRYARKAVTCLQLDSRLNVACDRAGGSLFALRKSNLSLSSLRGDNSMEFPCEEIFSFYLGEGATRLKNLPHPTHWEAIGCTLLGTLFCITPLSEYLHLLSTLQQKLATFPLTRPRLGNSYTLFRSQSAVKSPQLTIIDGWLLRQYFHLSDYQQWECLSTFTLQEPCCRDLAINSYQQLHNLITTVLANLPLSRDP